MNNLHGKATVQLFSRSGKELKKVVDNNIITNGVRDMLNARVKRILYRNGLSHKSLTEYDMVDFYKGMVLFGETLTENANNYDYKCEPVIACGSGAYAGSSLKRGLYNDGESGYVGENKYRIVYEWPTAYGNGTIKCISLMHTAPAGSDYGLLYAESRGYSPIRAYTDPSSITANFLLTYADIGVNSNSILGELDGKILAAISYFGTVTIVSWNFKKADIINPLVLPTMDALPSKSYSVDSGYYAHFNIVNETLYCFETDLNGTSRIKTLDPDDLSVITSVALGTDKKTFHQRQNFGILGNYLYTISYSTPRVLHKFNLSTGAYIEDIPITNTDIAAADTGALTNHTDDMLVLGLISSYESSRHNGVGCMFDGTYFSGAYFFPYVVNYNGHPYSLIKKLPSDRFGVLYLNSYSSNDNYVYAGTNIDFLTTINNLATPVTKTDSEAMKVTYEISWT